MSENLPISPPESSRTVLLVENEAIIRLDLAAEFEAHGFSVIETPETSTAAELFCAERIDAVVVDADLAGEPSSFDLVRTIRHQRPNCPIVMLTTQAFRFPSSFDQHVIIEPKPCAPAKLALTLDVVTAGRSLPHPNRAPPGASMTFLRYSADVERPAPDEQKTIDGIIDG